MPNFFQLFITFGRKLCNLYIAVRNLYSSHKGHTDLTTEKVIMSFYHDSNILMVTLISERFYLYTNRQQIDASGLVPGQIKS